MLQCETPPSIEDALDSVKLFQHSHQAVYGRQKMVAEVYQVSDEEEDRICALTATKQDYLPQGQVEARKTLFQRIEEKRSPLLWRLKSTPSMTRSIN
jgi:hypothetical protein